MDLSNPKTVGMIVENDVAVFRPIVLHENPDIAWIGNLDERTDRLDHVAPLIKTDNPMVTGEAIVRYLARDLRNGREDATVFTDSTVPSDADPGLDATPAEKAECLRARMITKVLVSRTLNKKHQIQLLENLVYLFKVNHPEQALRIEQEKLRVRYKGYVLFKPTWFPARFDTIAHLVQFCGETYQKMKAKVAAV